ncbi:MAG: hypothetical protein EHM45_16585 [Desulfobacteraceae bacterium]|nr:MAG: hypothetical protein EHM45_16585 [Desulfobacteraceae bacterium]
MKSIHRLKNIYSLIILGTALSAWLAAGCGYHFKAGSEAVGIKIESLAIPLMASPSSEPGFEADFTEMIREEFIRHVKIPLVAAEEAHMVLNGKVVSVTTEPLTYAQQQRLAAGQSGIYRTTSSRRMNLKMEASLLDKSSGTFIWEDKTLEAHADFQVTADPLLTRYHQQKALQNIAQQLARRIYQQTVERF